VRAALAALAAAGAAGVAAWALLVEPRRVAVRRHTLRLQRWPGHLDGLRVAVMSDLHTGAPHVDEATVARLVAALDDADADLVALLGDYVDDDVVGAERVEPEAVAALLGRLSPGLGTFAVLGNHDVQVGARRVVAALRGAGVRVLEDDAAPAGDGLWVVGLRDAGERQPDIGGALAAVPPEAAVLVLAHGPDVFPALPGRAALTLAGHTHGGQVDLPLLRRLVVPSRFGARYAAGHVAERGRDLFVTRGVGTSRLPIRLRSRPEVVVLTLRPNGQGDD
jgi:predicted MPP superfamily phosphohydrolase